ncbi:Opi1-domain-containing protein [Dentipellis sp. KUC8613]|nr:Opi1-domain-containing protein [Dentipellis sp. KUC8613]
MSLDSRPARPRTIDDEDESVRIAVRALGDMRSRAVAVAGAHHPPTQAHTHITSASSFQPTPALSTTSSATSPTLASPRLAGSETESEEAERERGRDRDKDSDAQAGVGAEAEQPAFVARVSTLPIVNTALRAYEQSKASSRVVKYGAEMMESSVKSISRPVIDRLPVNVNQLDEFACRQLDRLGRYGGARAPMDEGEDRGRDRERVNGSWESGLQIRDVSMARPEDRERERERVAHEETSPEDSKMRTPLQSPRSPASEESPEQQQQVVQRSRWQAVLLEAGGIGAAVSEESMRRLKYCLQWLQYATAHIDGQIIILRDFIAALQPPPGSPHAINPHAVISPEHMRQLANAKRDVVDTIRQVVDIVSKYAGSALPEPARSRVRGFILHLPQAWASAARRQGQQDVQNAAAGNAGSTRGRATRRTGRRERGGDRVSGESSRPVSPSSSPRHSRQSSAVASGAVPPTADAATQAAQRILTLAMESLDMMRGVTSVVKDSLDRADAWVDRLRVVGLQRGAGAEGQLPDRLPPPSDLMQHRAPPSLIGSTSTSVASSPVMLPTVLPPLRSHETLSPLIHPSGDAYFSSHAHGRAETGAPASSMGFGKLNIGNGAGEYGHGHGHAMGMGSGSVTPVSATPGPGKKGMFAEEGEGGTGADIRRRAVTPQAVDDGGTAKMEVDG